MHLWTKVKEALEAKGGYAYGADYQLTLVKAMNPHKLSVADVETLEDLETIHCGKNKA